MNLNTNELYQEILDLIPKFSFYHKLDRDEQISLLSTVFMNIYDKIQSNKLSVIPSERTGYIMISIKNEIYKVFIKNNTTKRLGEKTFITDVYENVNDLTNQDNDRIARTKRIKEIINHFSPKERALIRFKLRGWTNITLAIAFDVTDVTITNRLRKLEKRIKKIYFQ